MNHSRDLTFDAYLAIADVLPRMLGPGRTVSREEARKLVGLLPLTGHRPLFGRGSPPRHVADPSDDPASAAGRHHDRVDGGYGIGNFTLHHTRGLVMIAWTTETGPKTCALVYDRSSGEPCGLFWPRVITLNLGIRVRIPYGLRLWKASVTGTRCAANDNRRMSTRSPGRMP